MPKEYVTSTQAFVDDGAERAFRRFMTLRIRRLTPYSQSRWDRVRVIIFAVLLNAALRVGFVIALIGPCRTGKTYLLQQFLAGKIVDRSGFWRESSMRPLFSIADTPNGPFAIDEIAAFEPWSLFDGVIALAQSGRSFALAAQCIRDFDEANIGRALMGRRVLVVSLEPSRR